MILVDTSVWVDHVRQGVPVLSELLEQHQILMHASILGELACSNLKSRRERCVCLPTAAGAEGL